MGTKSTPRRPSAQAADTTRAMNAIRGIVRALRVSTRSIETQLGISLAQLFVLQQLAEKPATSLNDLSQRTGTHQSSVSVVVSRLVDRGLVRRGLSKEDKRRVELELTGNGREVLAKAPTTIQAQLIDAFTDLPGEDRLRLAELLERWVGTAGIDVEAPPMLGEE
jgi:DNA-binding MarR family transcriptional regulator